MWRYCAVLLVVSLRLAGTTDLYWRPNSDWMTPKNWALGYVPCEGETADLSSVSLIRAVVLNSRSLDRTERFFFSLDL